MAILITDDSGKPKPQYENETGNGFEAAKGKNGHMNMRSNDGEIVSIGLKADAAITDPTQAASLIALIKGLVKQGNKVGSQGNAWNNVAVAAAGLSNAVDVSTVSVITIFGNVSAATNITVTYSEDNTNFYNGETITVSAAGNFYSHIRTGAKFIKLKSSAAATITATIAGKA